MIQAADAFMKYDRKPNPLYPSSFYHHVRAIFEKLQVRGMEYGRENIPTFVFLFQKNDSAKELHHPYSHVPFH